MKDPRLEYLYLLIVSKIGQKNVVRIRNFATILVVGWVDFVVLTSPAKVTGILLYILTTLLVLLSLLIVIASIINIVATFKEKKA